MAAFHHAIYSVGDHADDDGIEERREKYTPIFKSIGVDMVFTGHDHSYTRSKTIDGTVYFTLGSSTGTKYYDHSDDKYDFDAFTFQEHYPCITKTDVTAGSFTVTTYRLNSDGGLTTVDKITLTK